MEELFHFDLPFVLAAVIGFGVAMYIILDGFDLGVGILFPLAPGKEERDVMMSSIATVWDGNETWLVLGGASLFAAFPAAYAMLLPALYLPIILFLFALVFRGVAFEFRSHAEEHKWAWSLSFGAGSALAAFAQGLVLGTFVQGFAIETGAAAGGFAPRAGEFAGGPFDWLSPFSLMTGVALVVGYALLGATWLVLKTEGDLQDWAYRRARWLMVGVILFMGIVSLWTPLAEAAVAERWFTLPNFLYLMPVPVLTAAAAFRLWWALEQREELSPFVLSVALFLLGYAGLAISLWPYIVPRHLTIWEAAAPPETQLFVLVGVAVLMPIVLGYTVHTYRVFRGKVRPGEGYH